ncbi:MAG: EAL domain-containing protein [Oscillospiraceae bacterium]|nr:EAL domain-containing protein [Oscillospiraceae bacterium]
MDKRRPLIAVLVDEADRSFICGALNYIQKELFAADMDVAVFSTLLTRHEDISMENKLFEIVNYDSVDGVIAFLKGLNSEDIRKSVEDKLKRIGKPVVYIDEYEPHNNNTVFDYDECAEIAVSHLAEVHGVKTAAFVGGYENSEYFDCLRKSFLSAIERHGISIPEGMVYYGRELFGDYGAIADSLIEKGLPQAVICCSDYAAVSVIGELYRRNISVPEDIIVTGSCFGEPYTTDKINITSVKRDPSGIAINAARKLISMINHSEYVPSESSSSELVRGISCGCGHIDLHMLSEAARRDLLPYGDNGFDSCYNYMQDELFSAPDFSEFLWKLDWYTFYISGLKSFWMCLNENIMHISADITDYSDVMELPYMRIEGQGSVDTERKFSRSEMLPFIFEKRDKPSSFIFTPLHFDKINFGYIVLSFGDSGAMYDSVFVKWLRYVTRALEKQRRHTIYCDDTTNAQIRDQLTGLLNMRGFKRIMTEEFNRSKGKLLRIISVDVDNLNGINKAYGYKEGDKVLQKMAVILNNCAGDGDICVRVSGDEFIIAGILDNDNPADEVPVKLERNLDSYNSTSANGYGIHIFYSRVTAVFDSKELLDKLPYDAAYQRNMTKDNHQKNRLMNLPSGAEEYDPNERRYVAKMLNDNLLQYQFQPIIDAHTGEIFAYEALMRSSGEARISPVAILKHASALGRLGDVERLTMLNTFGFLYEHREEFGCRLLFVNSIPSCFLSDEDFDELYSKFKSVMENVVIEFTEQTEANSEQLKAIIDRSRKMKFKIAIDDYGTGYSNISNLLNFMPHCVKIDRSLIMNIQSDKRKQHFTRNIIEYAHDNNFNVLAEGVETVEELSTVISMGVDLIQGYYTARPSYNLVNSIEPEIAEEIVRFYSQSKNTYAPKTYFTCDETKNDIKSLDLDNFTEIFISGSYYTLTGSVGYTSDLMVIIKDNIECTLNLCDVELKNEHGDSSIIIGRNSKLTLNISGEVFISGSILVPENAELKIVGSGRLSVVPQSDQKFAIGCDLSHSYGNIGIYLKNRLEIRTAAEKSVAIGGGYNRSQSKIDIRTEELIVDISGKKVLGIGCFYSKPIMNITGSSASFRLLCADGIAMGSFGTGIEASVIDSGFKVKAEGDNISGIYSVDAANGIINISDCNIVMKYNGKNIHGIGYEKGGGEVNISDSSCDIRIEGKKCFAVGSSDKRAEVAINKCSGIVYVAAADPHIVFADNEHLTMTDCEISGYEGS